MTVDKAFREHCAFGFWGICFWRYKHISQSHAIFTEAWVRYLYSGCAYIQVSHWELLNSSPYGTTSGCVKGSTGALQTFAAAKRGSGQDRDVWHLFTGMDFTDGGTVGCASVGSICSNYGAYGVNHLTFTNDINLQATVFAHELGHNLGAGKWGALPYTLPSGVLLPLHLHLFILCLLGAGHTSGGGIMGGTLNGGMPWFEKGSIDAMQNRIAANCS